MILASTTQTHAHEFFFFLNKSFAFILINFGLEFDVIYRVDNDKSCRHFSGHYSLLSPSFGEKAKQ